LDKDFYKHLQLIWKLILQIQFNST